MTFSKFHPIQNKNSFHPIPKKLRNPKLKPLSQKNRFQTMDSWDWKTSAPEFVPGVLHGLAIGPVGPGAWQSTGWKRNESDFSFEKLSGFERNQGFQVQDIPKLNLQDQRGQNQKYCPTRFACPTSCGLPVRHALRRVLLRGSSRSGYDLFS